MKKRWHSFVGWEKIKVRDINRFMEKKKRSQEGEIHEVFFKKKFTTTFL